MPATHSNTERRVVVGLGEVLFDCLPSRVVLGGAPVNVAVHAHQLLAQHGGCGMVASRVGNDELGRRVVDEIESRDIVADFLQVDPLRPTGVVNVKLSETGEPNYEIAAHVAWDGLEFDAPLERLAAQCHAVCFGTLAQRSEPSRTSIRRFLAAADSAIRLFDVNLRQHFFNREILHSSMAAATVVKLNHDELCQVCELFSERFDSSASVDRKARQLQQEFKLACVAVTHGGRGTVLYYQGDRFEGKPIAIRRAVDADAVGAGDACSAGLIFGLLMQLPPEQIVELANRLGSFVASQPGATPLLPADLLEFATDLRR